MKKDDCIFCKVVDKTIASPIFYEDDKTLVFLDKNPVNMGHSLVIPKEHFVNIHDTPEEILSHMIKVAKKIAKIVKLGTNADGINVHVNNEKAAGQAVFHTHIHIIPRFENDGFTNWESRKNYSPDEDKKLAQKFSSML